MTTTTIPQCGRTRVPLEGLRIGATLKEDIRDDGSRVLLISSGQRLTTALIDKLFARGIRFVDIGAANMDCIQSDGSPVESGEPQAEQDSETRSCSEAADEESASGQKAADTTPCGSDTIHLKREETLLCPRIQSSAFKIKEVFWALANQWPTDLSSLDTEIRLLLEELARDRDRFVIRGLKGDAAQYPFVHSIQVARLALALGAALHSNEKELLELGKGCLLHDVGMLVLNPDLINAERPLDLIEKLDITKHPSITFDLLRDNNELPAGSKMIAYQMHERLDGSGYPRRRMSNQIYPPAKIAMVADVFIAMISERPHRPPVPPYYAMVELLEMTKAGKLDQQATRGLLNILSLFPLGSLVELSDGRIARVIRANGDRFSSPVVEAWNRQTPDSKEEIDLKERKEVTILRPYLTWDLELAARSTAAE